MVYDERWEYKIIQSPDEDNLNHLGDEGWELVAVMFRGQSLDEAFLKRKKG